MCRAAWLPEDGATTATALVHTLSCPLASVLQVAGVQPPKKVIITYKPDADSKTVQVSWLLPLIELQMLPLCRISIL